MLAQLWIAAFGLTSSFLVYCRDERVRRWAPVLSLLAQPAWYWSSYAAHQRGVVVMSVFYTGLQVRGFWILWVRPARARRKALNAAISNGLAEQIRTGKRLPWQERGMEREFGSRH